MEMMRPGLKAVGLVTSVFLAVLLSPSVRLGAADSKPILSCKEAKSLIANARIPADHQRLGAYYRQEAQKLMNESTEHEALAATYEKWSTLATRRARLSLLRLAGLYRKGAKEAEALAAIHEEMARPAAKQ